MPREVVKNFAEHDRGRSLGWLALWWIEKFCVHGPGDVQGEPVDLDDEFSEIIVDCYAHDGNGRRLYDSVFVSRAKGRAKSELAGFVSLFEAFGPCRFDHWAERGESYSFRGERYQFEQGEPVGRKVTYPFLRCLATEEGQSGNTYDNIHFNLTNGPLAEGLPKDTAGLTRVLLPDGGEIVPSTASSASKDGGKETFSVFDEPMALDTAIPTPSGWKQIGDLRTGDYVFGVDGRPVLVYGVAPVKYDRPCYRVTFDDGESVVTDANHRWWTFDRKSTKKWAETSTEAMAQANWYGGKRFAVAQPDPIELPERNLLLDPYVLGMWLGDGDSSSAKLAVGRDDYEAVRVELERCGMTLSVYDAPDKGALAVRFNHGQRYGKSGTSQHALRELGVLGSKHVPDSYLWASRSQRLALLQGLMDSDGSANDRGNCVFTNKSRILAEAVVHLVRSLGWRATAGNWSSDDRWKARETGTWRVSFTPSGDVPFRLRRKAERCRLVPAEKTRAIQAIEPVESVPVRCIAVDSEDHLFLAGPSMLPTHNTHLYVLPELKQMYKTVRRNLGKRKAASPWSLETSTMYSPGEKSVAEETHELALAILAGKARRSRLFFDHVEAKIEIDELTDEPTVMAALREVYGPFSEVMDLGRIYDEILDPRNPVADSMRYFFNTRTSAADAWLTHQEVAAVSDASKVIADGEMIVFGFDGSRGRPGDPDVADSTCLVGIRLSDAHAFDLGHWEEPPGIAGRDWEVPEEEVEAAIAAAFARYNVVGFFGDPSGWSDQLARWTAKYSGQLKVRVTDAQPIRWKTNQHTLWAETLKELRESICGKRMTFDGSDVLARHLKHARKKPTRSGDTIVKPSTESPDKIDAAVALTYAWAAYLKAIAAGLLEEEDTWVPYRIR